MFQVIKIFFALAILALVSCGSENDENYMSPEDAAQWANSLNTEKVVGTPFEGLTVGDAVGPQAFLCGQYRTETIDEFPIPVFAALFTRSQETVIQDAIGIANKSMGFTAYEYTETWSDHARVLYAVGEMSDIGSPVGHTEVLTQIFNNKQYAERVVTDWAIRISFLPGAYIIAHELGHAAGIPGHVLIDYENDTVVDLEPGSIMQSDGGYGTGVMTDYDFMMSMQGNIVRDHLGEMGTITEDVGCSE